MVSEDDVKTTIPAPASPAARDYQTQVYQSLIELGASNPDALITASGDYAELHAGEDTHVIREKMQVLEERLDPDQFFRIHRSTIVRLDRIDALLFGAGGDYAVRLHDGKRLRVSRNRYEALQQRLGIDAGL